MKTVVSLVIALPLGAQAQHVTNSLGSLVDAASRQAALKAATDPLLLEAIKSLHSRVATPLVPPPA